MSSETRFLRPFQGTDRMQALLSGARLRVGDRYIEGDGRVALTLDEYLNFPIAVELAPDQAQFEDLRRQFDAAAADMGIPLADLELVVITQAPKLKMVDRVCVQPLPDVGSLGREIRVDRSSSRALRAPLGGCDLRVFVCLARERPPQALRAWRRGTWLARQDFHLRSDAGGFGFRPVRLTDELRSELGLAPSTLRYAQVSPDVSVFDSEVPADAVLVYVDEIVLDRMSNEAASAVGKHLQRQLFMDAAGAIAVRAAIEVASPTASPPVDIDDHRGSLVHAVVGIVAGADGVDGAGRHEVFRRMLEDPVRFVSNLEARLVSRRDVLAMFGE